MQLRAGQTGEHRTLRRPALRGYAGQAFNSDELRFPRAPRGRFLTLTRSHFSPSDAKGRRDKILRGRDLFCRVAVTMFGHEGHEFSSSGGGAFVNILLAA